MDLPLLSQLVEWVVRSEDASQGEPRWEQNFWGRLIFATLPKTDKIVDARNICGSAYCMAGRAVVASGYALEYFAGEASMCGIATDTGLKDRHGNPFLVPDPTGRRWEIPKIACHVLGIEVDEGDILFSGKNTAGQIAAISCHLARVRGFLLPLSERAQELADSHRDWIAEQIEEVW